MNVYIVWDKSREEHGEIAELLDVFFSKEDAEHYLFDDHLCPILGEEGAIEEREVKGHLSAEQVNELANTVLARARGGMRVVIGDSTSRQYDKADQMAVYITNAVKWALVELGMADEDRVL